jgi:hypothetical protein
VGLHFYLLGCFPNKKKYKKNQFLKKGKQIAFFFDLETIFFRVTHRFSLWIAISLQWIDSASRGAIDSGGGFVVLWFCGLKEKTLEELSQFQVALKLSFL